jgi:hypothetical protein
LPGRYKHFSLRDRCREAASDNFSYLIEYIERAYKNGECSARVRDDVKGSAKNGDYLVDLSKGAHDDGGTRTAEPQPATLRLVGALGR